MHTGFVSPTFNHPIDAEQYVRLVPESATIKGMFFSGLLDALGAERSTLPQGRMRYVAFKDYPLVDQVRLIPQVAATLYPNLKLREAIRRIGHSIYPAFATSLVGKVLFAAVGKDAAALLQAGAKAYHLSSNVGKVELLELRNGFAQLNMRDMYNFIDCYQVGILEGALSVIGLQPTVRLQLDSLTSGVFELRW
jgi:uncharacterized protein (TIGR02265 family)